MPSQNAAAAEPRRHRYVPRFLMKNFAIERKAGHFQIWTFDKETGRSFRTAVENVAVESDFNSLERGGVRISLEAAMGMIESEAAAPIVKILERRSLSGLTPAHRTALDVFCALQFVRGTATRAQFSHLISEVTKRTKSLARSQDLEVAEEETADEEPKLLAFQLISEELRELARHFSSKDLLLFEAAEGTEFILGDNPIAMQNERDFGPYGNIGLALPGIEIYLPISARYSLGFYCPTILASFRDGMRKADGIIAQARLQMAIGSLPVANAAKATLLQTEQIRTRISQMPTAHDAGAPLPTGPDLVVRLNSLQVKWAERWLLGPSTNFDLARRMITANAAYKSGMRFSVA